MDQLVGHAASLGWVALKATLLFLTAVIGFRLGERRTLAEMAAYDFVAAVACGAIVGRVPNSDTTSFAEGAVTLVAILVVHSLLTRLRLRARLSGLIDHPPRILVRDGVVDGRQLRRAGLTPADLGALLREHGVYALEDARYVIFEQRGSTTIVKRSAAPDGVPPLLDDVLVRA